MSRDWYTVAGTALRSRGSQFGSDSERRMNGCYSGRRGASVRHGTDPSFHILFEYMELSMEAPVIVGFESRTLAALCESAEALDRKFGRATGALVRQRLYEIAGVPTLADLVALPAVTCEQRVDGDGLRVALAIADGLSLVVEPYGDGPTRRGPEEITDVTVISIDQALEPE